MLTASVVFVRRKNLVSQLVDLVILVLFYCASDSFSVTFSQFRSLQAPYQTVFFKDQSRLHDHRITAPIVCQFVK